MSTLKADTIQSTGGGAATLTKQSAAKAWFEYTSITSTALAGSFNISGVTDNGTGDTSLSFTNNMSSSVYVANASDASFDALPTAFSKASCVNSVPILSANSLAAL